MSLILCIETGTDVCSVALARGGRLVSLREEAGRDHARKVALFLYLSVSSFLLCVVLLQSFTEDFLIGLLYILID